MPRPWQTLEGAKGKTEKPLMGHAHGAYPARQTVFRYLRPPGRKREAFPMRFPEKEGHAFVIGGMAFSGRRKLRAFCLQEIMKKAYPISKETWIMLNTAYEYDTPEYSGRPVGDICIGTQDTPGGEVYITEPFFLDILPQVFSKNVTVHVDLYSDPAVVVEKNGKLVLHNGDTAYLKERLDEVIQGVSFEQNRIWAVAELRRNRFAKAAVGRTTRVLREQITAALPEGVLLAGCKLNFDFLRLYLLEKYMARQPQGKAEEKVHSMDTGDLIYLCGCLEEYRRFSECPFQPLKQMLEEGITFEEAEDALHKELEWRLMSGLLR